MKVLVRMIIVAVMASGGLGGYSMTVGKDTIVGIQTQKVISKIQNLAGGQLPDLKWLNFSKGTTDEVNTYDPVLQSCLDAMFFENKGFHFSQSKWGAQSVPYQFRGLEVIGPREMMINGADNARGIERRISFEFYVEAFRNYDKAEGWKSWNIEMPPNLDGIVLVLHAGSWKIASSPLQSYNLK
ncbi:MAG: hypothetical protein P1U58_09855 [Verrucomicrobiales bacterium]|nr:hypothetical protein [Verrucomicrobiales bacterium]